MAGLGSAYVHSNFKNVESLSVNINLINNMKGTGQAKGDYYVQSTINKLKHIEEQLRDAADDFLTGFSPEQASYNADNAGDLLVQLANNVLYGSQAAELANTLTRTRLIDSQKLIAHLKANGSQIGSALANEIIQFLQTSGDIGAGELATHIVKFFNGNSTVVEVTEAGSHIVQLGNLLNVDKIQTSLRKQGEADINEAIFKGAQLVTNRKGHYRGIIRDLIKSSNYLTKPKEKHVVINSFCQKLQDGMLKEAQNLVKFMWTDEPGALEQIIREFINGKGGKGGLRRELLNVLDENKISDKSNTRGVVGEEVRTAVYKVANGTMISLQIGAEADSKGVDKVNKFLKQKGWDASISELVSHHEANKDSQTDVVILNTNTKKVARAQSKNHFVAYFINEDKQNDENIENFRWMVQENTNLWYFLNGLSKSELGMGLNNFDLTNISSAMANNLWFKYHDSAFPGGDNGIGFAEASPEDFQKELEGSLEKLLAGQITNLLGVTVTKSVENNVDIGASNIFYLLNGRIKYSADLVHQAIEQLNNSENLKLSNSNRLVIVNLNDSKVKSLSPGKGSSSFLPQKLQSLDFDEESRKSVPTAETIEIGERMGSDVLDAMQINVSLGTSIEQLRKTSFIL